MLNFNVHAWNKKRFLNENELYLGQVTDGKLIQTYYIKATSDSEASSKLNKSAQTEFPGGKFEIDFLKPADFFFDELEPKEKNQFKGDVAAFKPEPKGMGEAFVGSGGVLGGFETPDDEYGEGTTEFLAGVFNVRDIFLKIPGLPAMLFREPFFLKEIAADAEAHWKFQGDKGRKNYIDTIRGAMESQAGMSDISLFDIGAASYIVHFLDRTDQIKDEGALSGPAALNTIVAPYLAKKGIKLPFLQESKVDFVKTIKIAKVIKKKNLIKEAEIDADGNLVGFRGPNWRKMLGEYDHIHFFIKKQDADKFEDQLIRAGVDMIDHYQFGSKYLFRVSLGSDVKGDLQKAEKIIGQPARKDSPETNWRMKTP